MLTIVSPIFRIFESFLFCSRKRVSVNNFGVVSCCRDSFVTIH